MPGTKDHIHNVGHCYRCGTVIEPLLREQWFIDMQPLAKKAVAALETNKITFYPESKKAQLINYLGNLRDWNISRQIAWGIAIPAFQNVDDADDWIYDERVDQELLLIEGKTYHRDPDVFDTWFSSSSWPYATLDFPDGSDFKQFYPLSLMETGGEILYQWVGRMIMLGIYITGEIPFRDVYIHGYVMAENGAKMSKSLGNVVDPIPVIEAYGSDAVRMVIISGRSPAVNRGYDPRRVEEARNFCNKLWNISRYIENSLPEKADNQKAEPKSSADHWILHKTNKAIEDICTDLDNYRLSEAYDKLYHFVWDDLADWYIEATKIKTNTALLSRVLEAVLIIAHPFAPFLTETIWQTLPSVSESVLATRQLITLPKADESEAKVFEDIKVIVTETRFILSSLRISGVTLYYTDVPFLQNNSDLIKRLGKLKAVTEVRDGNGLFLTQTPYRCWLDIDQHTATGYLSEIDSKKADQQVIIKQLESRLANKQYVKSAPHHIVEQTKAQLSEAKKLLDNLDKEYQRFSAQI